jgi:uncharacterized protein (DUF342 family)
MANITFQLAEDQVTIELSINDLTQPLPTEEVLCQLFSESGFSQCKLLKERLASTIETLSAPDVESKLAELPLLFPFASKRDASLEINISDDKMQAIAHLVTAQGGDNLSKNNITEQLAEVGVCEGINKDVILKLFVEATTAEPGTEFNVVIAEGLAVIDPVETQYEYLVIPLQDRALVPQEQDDGSVNMRDFGKIETINPGEALVKRIPAKRGSDGHDVFGTPLLANVLKELPLTPGIGTHISDNDSNLLIAAESGVPYRTEQGMEISNALVLDNVNLEVGNIDFEGTVIVNGDVAANMKVKATDDVIVSGLAESCTIEAGGSITVCNGVLGQEIKQKDQASINFNTKLSAGKDITIRHAQSVQLKACGTITVSSQLLHSHVTTEGGLIVGGEKQTKPKIIGGVIKAPFVSAGEIGTAANSKVIINFSNKLNQLNEAWVTQRELKTTTLETQMKVEQLLVQLKANKATPIIDKLCEKVSQGIKHATAQVTAAKTAEERLLAEKEQARKDIRVTIYGRIFPGVEFIICKEKYRTRSEIPKCTVRFRDRQIQYDKAES